MSFYVVSVTGIGGAESPVNTFSDLVEAVQFGARLAHEHKTSTVVRPLRSSRGDRERDIWYPTDN